MNQTESVKLTTNAIGSASISLQFIDTKPKPFSRIGVEGDYYYHPHEQNYYIFKKNKWRTVSELLNELHS